MSATDAFDEKVAMELDERLRATGQRLDGSRQSRVAFVAGKVRRHVRWARTEGIRKLIEEDELNPWSRTKVAVVKARWRREHRVAAGTAMPVFLVGLQRSGTNMIARGLDGAPEFQVFNENDSRAFTRYRLRDDSVIDTLIEGSRQQYVLFKPLCDSHRVVELLERHSGAERHSGRRGAAAVWAFRDFEGRARSAVAKFGDSDLVVLRALKAGLDADLWQTQRLSPQVRERLLSFDVDSLDAHSASALFWWARNSLFFDLGLDTRDDVALVSYGQFRTAPERQIQTVCRVLGLEPRPSLVIRSDDRASGAGRASVCLDPDVRALCAPLLERLERAAAGSG